MICLQVSHVACSITTDSPPAAVPQALVQPSSIVQPLRPLGSIIQGADQLALQRIAQTVSSCQVALVAGGAAVMRHGASEVGSTSWLNKVAAVGCLELVALRSWEAVDAAETPGGY